MLSIGVKFAVLPTPRNRNNGLLPGKGAWIQFMDDQFVSLYFEQAGCPALKIKKELLATNFQRQPVPPAIAYKASAHAKTLYK